MTNVLYGVISNQKKNISGDGKMNRGCTISGILWNLDSFPKVMQQLQNYFRKDDKLVWHWTPPLETENSYNFFRTNQQKISIKCFLWNQYDFSVNWCDWFILVGNGLSEPYVRVSKLMNICEKERKFDKESFQLLCIIFLNLDHYYTTIFVKTMLYTTLLNIILDTKT